MKNKLSDAFIAYQGVIKTRYFEVVQVIKSIAKNDKKMMLNMKKTNHTRLLSIQNNIKLFNQEKRADSIMIFLSESLDIFKKKNIEVFGIPFIKDLNIHTLLKDKEFKIYLNYILLADLILSNLKGDELSVDNFIDDLSNYFGDINSIFLSYCILKEENLTINKIKNITSFIMKGIEIVGKEDLSYEQQIVLEQIQTGIKYEKLTESANNTNFGFKAQRKFNILEKAKHTIRIKYVSDKEYKHRTHKSPKEHYRKGFFKILPNGKRIWIKPTIVNRGVA